jgi:hypothetical protein
VLATDAHDPSGVLGGLLRRPPDTTWAAFAASLELRETTDGWANAVIGPIPAADLASWRHLALGLVDATALVKLKDLTTFQLWAPRVARFSFLSTTAIIDAEHENRPLTVYR